MCTLHHTCIGCAKLYVVDSTITLHNLIFRIGKKHNFAKKNVENVTGLGLPYDYDGLMHYGAYAFARDKTMPTIVKLKNTGGPIGQRKGFSRTDLEQINLLYDCKSKPLCVCFNGG